MKRTKNAHRPFELAAPPPPFERPILNVNKKTVTNPESMNLAPVVIPCSTAGAGEIFQENCRMERGPVNWDRF